MAGLYDEQILGARQQAETARRLREGITAPEGQMVSGWYVPPSITQYLASALKTYGAANDERKAQASSDSLTKQKAEATANALRQLQPQTHVSISPEFVNQAISGNGSSWEQAPQTQTWQEAPDDRQRMAALLQLAQVNPEAAALPLKMQEFDMARQDKKDAMEWQAQQAREQKQQQFENQKELVRLTASLRPEPQERMVVVADANGNPVYLPQSQAAGQEQWNPKSAGKIEQNKTSAITAQQALDQAAALYAHPGREAGTGGSSWMQQLPATDAKGFGANLDTFKAKTFLDAVQAMKGLGALTEQEGAKLVASIGALDPSMKEEEFVDNLKQATRDMYAKAKAKGLDVVLPQFAVEQTSVGHPPDIDALINQYKAK